MKTTRRRFSTGVGAGALGAAPHLAPRIRTRKTRARGHGVLPRRLLGVSARSSHQHRTLGRVSALEIRRA